MKPLLKSILFLLLLTVFDLVFRKGFLNIPFPFQLPNNGIVLILFTLFAIIAWKVTKWFCKWDKMDISNLGISWNKKNRVEFYYGVLIGIGLWAIVSLVQSYSAGFSWELRPNISLVNIFYGFIFIWIADLGTELFTRGYPLTKLTEAYGSRIAIMIMVCFVGIKSFSFEAEGEYLFYSMIIPALHTIFFSVIYLKTKRLGGALGVHVGANFVTISIFDLRMEQPNQAIPAGIFQPNTDLDTLSLNALQWPWVVMASVFSIVVYFWWINHKKQSLEN